MKEIIKCKKTLEERRKRDILMRSTEETQTDRNNTPEIGDLVRFMFLQGQVSGNIHQMSEAVGIVVSVKDYAFKVSVDDKVIDGCWIVEVIRSV